MKFKLLLALMLFGAVANAQTAINKVTPAHLRAAEDMLIASGAGEQMQANIDVMIKAGLGDVSEDNKLRINGVLSAFLGKYMNWDVLKDPLSAIYAQEFTEKELKDLTVFYLSPTGQKLKLKQPTLIQKSSEIAQMAVKSHQVELQEMIENAFKQ